MTLLVFCLSSACTSDPSQEAGVDRADSSPAISPDSAARDELATAPDSLAAAGEPEPDSIAWTEEPIRVSRTIPDAAVVTAIRAGEHEGFDRFVVEFQNGGVPGYEVMYLNGDAHECGSGGLIDLLGTERLEVRLEPARGYDEEGRSTIDHAQRDFDLKVLEEAEISCDFEAVFAVVLGTAGERPFRISESENPARLVVDIRHEGEWSRHSLIHRMAARETPRHGRIAWTEISVPDAEAPRDSFAAGERSPKIRVVITAGH